jgi:hypothetical protein
MTSKSKGCLYSSTGMIAAAEDRRRREFTVVDTNSTRLRARSTTYHYFNATAAAVIPESSHLGTTLLSMSLAHFPYTLLIGGGQLFTLSRIFTLCFVLEWDPLLSSVRAFDSDYGNESQFTGVFYPKHAQSVHTQSIIIPATALMIYPSTLCALP